MKLPTPLTVILVAGLVCGTLDALSASLVSALFGATPVRVFQGIASGLRGRSAFQGGVSTALLGLASTMSSRWVRLRPITGPAGSYRS